MIFLQDNIRSLKYYISHPYPYDYVINQLESRIIYLEINYDVVEFCNQSINLFNSLTYNTSIANYI